MPVNVVLFQPEIPPNTGNVIRLCANSGACLHLIEPLGFDLDNAKLKRAGLDYHEWADVKVHPTLQACLQTCRVSESKSGTRVWAFSTRGTRHYASADFATDDVLLFGPETRGLPDEVLDGLSPTQILRMPMRPGSRSLNLSNTVAIAVFEAWRQLGFAGGQ